MKFAIYQYFAKSDTKLCDINSSDYYNLSHKSVSKYSFNYNIDYQLITKGHKITPFYGIFTPFSESLFDNYDAICFIDSDILITIHAENLFNYYNKHKITCHIMPNLGHANTGVVIFPKIFFSEIKSKIIDNLSDLHTNTFHKYGPYDQFILNKFYLPDKIHNLPEHMNYILHHRPFESRFEKNIIHYNSYWKDKMHEDFNNPLILK